MFISLSWQMSVTPCNCQGNLIIHKKKRATRAALKYLGFDGNFNHAIIIRSILSRNNQLEFRAGAGVVIESNIEDETQEVYNKTNALRKAIKLANHEK